MFPTEVPSLKVFFLLPSLICGGRNFREWRVLPHLRLLSSQTCLLTFRRGATPPQWFDTRSPQRIRPFAFAISSLSVCLIVSYSVFLLPRRNCSFRSVTYAVVALRTRPSSLPECRPFCGYFCKICPAWPVTNKSFEQYRNGTTCHLSSGGGQLTSGPTIALPGSVSSAVGGVL